MNLSSITGVLLVVGAVIWLGVFIPNWVKRGHEVEQSRQIIQQVRRQVNQAIPTPKRTTQVSAARQAMRLSAIRRSLAILAIGGGFVGVFALTDLSHFSALATVSFALAGFAILLNRFASKKQRNLLEASVSVRSRSAANYRAMYQTAVSLAPENVVADRSWTPRELPAPMHVGHVGSLEQPTLAQVKQLAVAPVAQAETQESEQIAGANLDEILRRRRAI